MNTRTLFSTMTMAVIMLISVNMNAQEFPELDVSPMDAASFPSDYRKSDKAIKIIYSRPQLKGRQLEKLAPNGEVWRTGANEAAEITFYKTVKFGEHKIAPGTYTFFVIPGEKEWTAILSSELNVWGSYSYNEKNDVARTTVSAIRGKSNIKVFSIAFKEAKDGAIMYLAWADVRVPFKFEF